jgi:hypothetical protein
MFENEAGHAIAQPRTDHPARPDIVRSYQPLGRRADRVNGTRILDLVHITDYPVLNAGDAVKLDYAPAQQDSFWFVAIRVRKI